MRDRSHDRSPDRRRRRADDRERSESKDRRRRRRSLSRSRSPASVRRPNRYDDDGPQRRRDSASPPSQPRSSFQQQHQQPSSENIHGDMERTRHDGDEKKERYSFKDVKPEFKPSGALAREANTTETGIVLKYSEPPESRMPTEKYRMYVFKGDSKTPVDVIPLQTQSAFLFGRERAVADVPIDHASCSKQHAVVQFRLVDKVVKPYLIDLDSANGTQLNNAQISARRYYELLPGDIVSFGASTREYVFLREDADSA